MAVYKATYIFNTGRQGWTETFYLDRATRVAAYNSAAQVGLVRALMMGKGAVLEAIRTSDVIIPGDSDYVVVGNLGEDVVLADNRDLPETAWLIRADSAGLYRRMVYMRGLPDDWTRWNQVTSTWLPVAEFVQAFGAWSNEALNQDFKIQAISKVDAAVNQKVVSNAAADGTGVTYTATAHGYAVNDKVKVSRLQGTGAKYANRVGIIDVVAANTFHFLAPDAVGQAILISKPGIARRQQIIYVSINSFTMLRPVSHKTGRAFFVPRGRRRVTK